MSFFELAEIDLDTGLATAFGATAFGVATFFGGVVFSTAGVVFPFETCLGTFGGAVDPPGLLTGTGSSDSVTGLGAATQTSPLAGAVPALPVIQGCFKASAAVGLSSSL